MDRDQRHALQREYSPHFIGLKRLAFRVSTSIAVFARGFSEDPLIALQERGIQTAFANGATFVVQEN